MALPCPKLIVPLLAASALLGLGACSPLQHGTDSVTGPGRSGVHPQMIAGCPTLEANTVANPLVFNTEVAMVPQFRTGRLRIESIGDVATTSILSMGPCAATDIPTINFISGHANVFVSNSTQSITTTGTRLTFGALLFNPIIPGSVNANDAQGNSFQVIWPALAGVGTGSPRIRVQLAQWDQSLVNPSSKLDVSWDLIVSQNGVQTFIRGSASGLTMDGLGVFPGGGAILPCQIGRAHV